VASPAMADVLACCRGVDRCILKLRIEHRVILSERVVELTEDTG
jgi:hypothetical protein